MNWIKDLMRKILPYGLIVKINELRGYSYLDGEIEVQKKVNFYKSFLNGGDLVFDVGANYGNRVHPFLLLSTRVVAVEPLPDCVRYLKYEFGNKIEIENICLGAEKGESDLFVGKVNVISTLSSKFMTRTIKSGRFSTKSWGESIKVKVSTLDELVAKYGRPKFIKIDTEGYEMEVISGLSDPVQYVSFEYTLPEFSQDMIDILNTLDTKGDMLINLSVGEQMKFVLERWIPLTEFVDFLQENLKGLTGWGDIYVKFEVS